MAIIRSTYELFAPENSAELKNYGSVEIHNGETFIIDLWLGIIWSIILQLPTFYHRSVAIKWFIGF